MINKVLKGKLYGVGTGPGEPSLITIKALNAIKESDIVLIPAKSADKCYAYKIVSEILPEIAEKELVAMPFPMTKDEDKLEAFYREMYEKIKHYLENAKNIVFLTIGDPGIYSTYMYLDRKVKEAGGNTEIISGVPSFCAAAARLGIPLGEREEQIHVIPGSYSIEETKQLGGTRIYMKSGKKLEELKEMFVREMKVRALEIYCVSNCGLESEEVGKGIDSIKPELGYLTIVIVKTSSTHIENDSRYFENRACAYYPCHKGIEHINCMFCYCPFYMLEKCPGNPRFIDKNGRKIKSCIDCSFPHRKENYDKIMERLKGRK